MVAQAQRRDLWDNAMGTDGFEFVEYTGPDPQALGDLSDDQWSLLGKHKQCAELSDREIEFHPTRFGGCFKRTSQRLVLL